MKIIALRKKIIISFSISGVLAAALGGIIFYDTYQKKSSGKIITDITGKITKIRNQSSELKNKAIEIKKYINMWTAIDANKKTTTGIKNTIIETSLKEIARKHYISLPEIKISAPNKISGGTFNSTTITTSFATVNLTFKAINDIKALLFIDQFIDSIPGYKIITSFEIDKQEIYSVEDLVSITSGESSGKIAAKVDFFWYAFEEKKNTAIDTKNNKK